MLHARKQQAESDSEREKLLRDKLSLESEFKRMAALAAAEQASLSHSTQESNAKCAAALTELQLAREKAERFQREVNGDGSIYHFCLDLTVAFINVSYRLLHELCRFFILV